MAKKTGTGIFIESLPLVLLYSPGSVPLYGAGF